jgi:hypothetical protein
MGGRGCKIRRGCWAGLVNKCNARCSVRVVVLDVRACWGKFLGGILYIWVKFTHLGCFDAQGGAGEGAREFATRPRSPGYQLGKRCQ